MTFKEFWNPPFCTSEFEAAKTRDGQTPEITSIKPGKFEGYPQKVFGKVAFNGMKEKVEWDRYGKCRKYYPTERRRKWDLVHPEHKKITQEQFYFIVIVALVAVLLLVEFIQPL